MKNLITLAVIAAIGILPLTPAENNSMFEVSYLIDQGLDRTFLMVRQKAFKLSSEDRINLYEMKKKKDTGGPFALNFFIGFGIGSYVQGDGFGGTMGLCGELGSLALIGASAGSDVPALAILGLAVFFGFRIFEWIRPFAYEGEYNAKLGNALIIGGMSYTPIRSTIGAIAAAEDHRVSVSFAVGY
ncbi:MAG: P13 family porin [Spirochaetota bacterium]